jgi:hypothetical protein
MNASGFTLGTLTAPVAADSGLYVRAQNATSSECFIVDDVRVHR